MILIFYVNTYYLCSFRTQPFKTWLSFALSFLTGIKCVWYFNWMASLRNTTLHPTIQLSSESSSNISKLFMCLIARQQLNRGLVVQNNHVAKIAVSPRTPFEMCTTNRFNTIPVERSHRLLYHLIPQWRTRHRQYQLLINRTALNTPRLFSLRFSLVTRWPCCDKLRSQVVISAGL